jgi:mercuric ion binding protein
MIRELAAVLALAFFSPLAAQAAERTVVLNVTNASCELCAPIVKASLARVAGVKTVEVKQRDRTADAVATVTFDDAVVGLPALIAATTNAGFPSHAS